MTIQKKKGVILQDKVRFEKEEAQRVIQPSQLCLAEQRILKRNTGVISTADHCVLYAMNRGVRFLIDVSCCVMT